MGREGSKVLGDYRAVLRMGRPGPVWGSEWGSLGILKTLLGSTGGWAGLKKGTGC